MYLKTIIVKNFRNLRDFSLNLQPGLNVLVGRNNMGKSNLLGALRLALGPSSARNETLWLTEDDFYRPSRTGPRTEVIQISLVFAGLSEDQLAQFFEIAEPDVADLPKSTASVHFEATWRADARRPQTRRWGGAITGERHAIPQEILEQIPLTFLPALREAEASLAPGPRSRLAPLLKDRATKADEDAIVDIYGTANTELAKQSLVSDATSILQSSARDMAGADYRPPSIEAAPAHFEKILRSLNVVIGDTPLASLSAMGLGYQNVIYISTILAHLEKMAESDCPLLLVEEPEAHLHPQLTVLLGEYLGRKRPGTTVPQTIVTTHSPTLAAHVRPKQVCVLYEDESRPGSVKGNAVADAGLDDTEERYLQRMLDVTRASLYFARGLILVEGISEQLLVPVLAQNLGKPLSKEHVSVVPICGVAFSTFAKLLSDKCFPIPVSIVTDGDPPLQKSSKTGTDSGDDQDGKELTWKEDMPSREGANFVQSDRTKKVIEQFKTHKHVKVFTSSVTLEYDLAAAGTENPKVMTEAWESCFDGKPRTLNADRLKEAGKQLEDQALAVWRGICLAHHSGSKADFAHKLADRLSQSSAPSNLQPDFTVPQYLKEAITHAIPSAAESNAHGQADTNANTDR